MKLYRIYTQDLDRERVALMVGQHFPGFTMLSGAGYWKGRPEACLIIEIVTDAPALVRMMAHNIRNMNAQESVMVTAQEVAVEFV